MIREHVAREQRDLDDVGPGDPWDRVEVDAELVGVLEIARPDRVRVEVDATEVHDPGELRRVAEDQLAGGAAGGKAQLHRLDPGRPVLGSALLVEGRLIRAVDVALEDDGPPRDPAQGSVGHGQVVVDELQLRQPDRRKVDLARVRHPDLTAGHRERLVTRGHAANLACRGRRTGRLTSCSVPRFIERAAQLSFGSAVIHVKRRLAIRV